MVGAGARGRCDLRLFGGIARRRVQDGSGSVGVVLLAALYLWYTSIVRRANKVREALGSIDVHLASATT